MKQQPLSLPVRAIQLTPSEQHDVIEEAAAVMLETLQSERQFFLSRGELNRRDWKKVDGNGVFGIFRERRRSRSRSRDDGRANDFEWQDLTTANTRSIQSLADSIVMTSVPMRLMTLDDSSGGTDSVSSTTSDGVAIVSAEEFARVPTIVAAGQVEGLLEDVVFGAFVGDDVSSTLRSAYMKDKLTGARVLATILGPTPDDPYRFLGIKWFQSEPKRTIFSPLLLDRDFLVIEATGLTRDEHGVPHGYQLFHSFRHPLVPEFTDRKILRCDLSLCYISRQVSANRVHIFGRGFVDPKGDLLQKIGIAMTTEAMMGCVNVVEASYSKKFMWVVNHRPPPPRGLSTSLCTSCHRTPGLLTGPLTFCRVCDRCICARCTVERHLVVAITSNGVRQLLFPFCLSCLVSAQQLPPHQVAVDTVVRPGSRRVG